MKLIKKTSSIFLILVFNGCALVANLPLPLTLLRSPVTLDVTPRNSPLTFDERCRLQLISESIALGKTRAEAVAKYLPSISSNSPLDIFPLCGWRDSDTANNDIDTFDDLVTPSTIVFVAISGGGSRATSLAAHTMSLLERKLNQLAYDLGRADDQTITMVKAIDAFSTVSGGSIYAYQIARMKAAFDWTTTNEFAREALVKQQTKRLESPDFRDCSNRVHDILRDFELCFFTYQRRTLQNVGVLGGIFYFSPFNLFLGPAAIAGSNLNYTDVLAGGLNIGSAIDERSDYGVWLPLSQFLLPTRFKLGDFPESPRVFFNATALETGSAFVFTKKLIHLPSDVIEKRTARLDNRIDLNHDNRRRVEYAARPIPGAFTLEELNSSPADFPAAYAAMASAAFPIGLQPLELRKFGFDPGNRIVYPSDQKISITDGGVFDNSGLNTLISLIGHIQSLRHRLRSDIKQRVLILAINAEGEDYDVNLPTRISGRESWYERWLPFSFNLPIRYRALGVDALNLIHFTNKRRAEELAIRKLQDLTKLFGEFAHLVYLPVSLSQLSPHDENPILDSHGLFERIRNIPTTFAIGEDDDTLIAQAADLILRTEQKSGWKLGPKCADGDFATINRLDEAFAFAILRKQDWASDSRPVEIDRWCKTVKLRD